MNTRSTPYPALHLAPWLTTTIRWLARLGSVLSLGMLSAFLFGGAEPNQLPNAQELVGFAFFPVGISIGMALGWWRERLGGTVTAISLVGFYVWHVCVSGDLPGGPYFVLFALPGLLFLLSGCLFRTQQGR